MTIGIGVTLKLRVESQKGGRCLPCIKADTQGIAIVMLALQHDMRLRFTDHYKIDPSWPQTKRFIETNETTTRSEAGIT